MSRLSLALFVLFAAVSLVAQQPQKPVPVRTTITVTAERGTVQETAVVPRNVAVADPAATVPPPSTAAHALEGAPNILLQQSTPGQVSPFLRGLTGYHVLNLIDGVRFNNATFRSGPNQYLAFVEPDASSVVEAVLGPASAAYGSDAMGGVIQVVTPSLDFSDAHRGWGELTAQGSSADASGGAAGKVGITTRQLAWLLGGSAIRYNSLRPGGGVDSRDVFRRFFGVSGLVGPRLPGTRWSRAGIYSRAMFAPVRDARISAWFEHSGLDGVDGYKDLLGGLGRLQSRFDPQHMNFGYLRAEKFGTGVVQSLSGTFSVNSQRDGSIRQGQRYTDTLTRERIADDALGYAAQAVLRLRPRLIVVTGTDIQDERVDATRTDNGRSVRPLYPVGSRYTTAAGFGQASSEFFASRLRLLAGGRFTGVRYSNPAADGSFQDWTWNAAASYQITPILRAHFLASRGFRAPNLNDLGALGLNDLGFEVPASEVGAAAIIGDSAGEAALSSGRAVQPLQAESLMNYEAGLRIRAGRVTLSTQAFHADFTDPIDRRTVLFPAGSVPASIAGLIVTPIPQTPQQRAAGLVTVASAIDPRALKAFVNFGRSRYYGTESSGEIRLANGWSLRGSWSYLHGRQLDPNRPVRRLPPQQGSGALLWNPAGKRYWAELRTFWNGPQTRLSGGDLDDERMGAGRSRRDIASFFGSPTALPLTPVGETLAAIQSRVLPGVTSDTQRVPLYGRLGGWMRVDVATGFRLGEKTTVLAGIDNLLDRNYRTLGSGVDGPGFNATLRIRHTF